MEDVSSGLSGHINVLDRVELIFSLMIVINFTESLVSNHLSFATLN